MFDRTVVRAIACAAVVAACPAVSNAHVKHKTVGEMAVGSDRIVVADVTAVTGFYVDPVAKVIGSRVDLQITDQLKGAGPEALSLTVLGGEVDGLTMRTCVSPTFAAGDHVLLFLTGPEPRLTGQFQGAWLTDGQETVQMGSGNTRYLPEQIEPFAGLLDEIRRALPGTFAGPVSPYEGSFSLQGGAAFVLSPCNWAYMGSPMGESYWINPNCTDAGCSNDAVTLDAILAGAQAWNDAGAQFSFTFAGESGSTNAPSQNNQNLVVFDNTFDAPGGVNDPDAIAITFFWCSGNNMVEWDMVYNDFDFNFWNGVGACNNRYDVQGIGAHEFGHCLGLDHTPIQAATMFAFSGPCNVGARTLHSDDIAGIQFIYGVDESPPPNDSCNAPIPIDHLETLGFNNSNATTDGFSEPCGSIQNDVWYRHTAQCDSAVVARLCTSSFDTELAIYPFPCPTGPNQAIACNDDECGVQSQVTFDAVQGQTYLIRAGGATGEGELFIFVTCVEDCVGDVNGDGEVDVDDLVELVLAWDTDDPDADINDDGTVDVDDLVELILAWGPCE